MPLRIPEITIQTANLGANPFKAAVFTPEKEDMSLLQRSLATLDERKEKTDQQRATIQAAIGKINLNAAEAEWKQNFIDNIAKQIDSAAQFGDYSAALSRATILAGEVASNQELLAKEKENENYETYKKELDTLYLNNKIDKDTRDYFMATNNYRFNGTYDENGNMKSYSLTEYAKPMQQVDLSSLFTWVGHTVAEQSGSSQGVGAKTATGKNTDYFSPDAAAISHSGQGWSRKDFDTINNVWNEALKRHPEAIRYMQQQMDVNQWLLNKTEKELENPYLDRNDRIRLEAEQQRLRQDLYVNGDESKPYSPQEYLYNSSRKTLESMAYNRINSTFNVSGGGNSGSYGTGNVGGGFSSLNLNLLTKGPSGMIGNALKDYLNTRIGDGSDIVTAVNNIKK